MFKKTAFLKDVLQTIARPFIAKSKDAANVLDCSKESYDLRPAADLIAAKVLKKIDQRNNDKPIVVLIGENHRIPTYSLLHSLVINRLSDTGCGLAVSLEIEANILANCMRENLNHPLPDELTYAMNCYDSNGKAALCCFAGYYDAGGAVITSHNNICHLIANDISTTFCDVGSRAVEGYVRCVDRSDPYVKTWHGSWLLDEARQDISMISGRGWMIRNYSLMYRGIHSSDVIIQPVGASHVFGVREYGFPYELSLHRLYNAENINLVPVFCKESFADVPPHALPFFNETIWINGLCSKEFSRRSAGAEAVSQESELDHIQKIFKASGHEIGFVHPDNPFAVEPYQKMAKTLTDEIMVKLNKDFGARSGPALSSPQ